MWILIAILCVIMMFLVCLALRQLKELKDKEINEEIEELRQLRRQEINNNTILVNKNRILQNFYITVKDLINSNELMITKIDKIKELTQDQKSNVT